MNPATQVSNSLLPARFPVAFAAVFADGKLGHTAVDAGVARDAKCYQVSLRIVTGVAAKFFVVDLKVGHRAAGLASPTIPT